MTDYVLEILDGDRAGDIVELTSDPVTFGRRAGNDIVLVDEKVSGKHATVALEEGQWVLRDLDSTNGTLLDGRRVEEIGLTANDIFQLGRVCVAFKEAGAPTPQIGGELAVHTLDSARLAKTRRGGGIGMLVALLVALGAAAGYWFYGGGSDQAGGGSAKPKAVLSVSGNVLAAGADMESEGGWKPVSGLQFSWDGGNFRAAHTGSGAMTAYGAEEGGAHHALARCDKEHLVSAGSGLRATAWVKTGGNARAALRLRFWSTAAGGQPVVLFTGTTPASYDGFTELSLSAGVPSGCDQAVVEILALLPDRDSEVSVDDVALVESQVEAHSITTKAGQRIAGCGSAIVMLDARSIVLSGLRPLTSDVGLQELDKLGLLGLSDVGMELDVQDIDGAIRLTTRGGSGFSLVFDAGIVASGALARQGEAAFTNHAIPFALDSVDNLLIGYGTSRLLLRLGTSAAVKGTSSGGRFVLTLPASAELDLVYDFAAQREQARALIGDAKTHLDAGEYAALMDKVDSARQLFPHDDRQLREADRLRTMVRASQGDRLRYLESELDNAVYFESLGGYVRIRDALAGLVSKYGEAHLLDAAKLAAMRERVDATIVRIEASEGAVTRKKLQVLAGVYGKGDDKELVTLIHQYIKEYLPATASQGDK